jgi:hypothetical protein
MIADLAQMRGLSRLARTNNIAAKYLLSMSNAYAEKKEQSSAELNCPVFVLVLEHYRVCSFSGLIRPLPLPH